MTAPTEPIGTAQPNESGPARTDELVLARAHLRLGALPLARTELESLAELDRLDTAGRVDLAEVRWRTGDLGGAGEAAATALEADADVPIALVIAAEAAAADGRSTEARRLATRAMEILGTRLDAVFAGMPRAGVWPDDTAEPPPTATTLFHREADDGSADGLRGSASAGRAVSTAPRAAATGRVATSGDQADAGSGATRPMAAAAIAGSTIGIWGSDSETDPVIANLPDPAGSFQSGTEALMAGRVEDAALQLGLAIRLAPAYAPAVLDATDGARYPGLIVVRGDAYRLVGHETEARQAYALAATGGLPERRRKPRPKAGPRTPDDASSTPDVDPGERPDERPAGPTGELPSESAADASG